MRYYIYSLALSSALICTANAEEYRNPTEFGAEEYEAVSVARDDYMYCMQDESVKATEQLPDPRQAADIAMKNCASILEKLFTNITMQGFSPDVAKRFTSNISNKGANTTLRNLMILTARKKQAQVAPAVEKTAEN